MSPALRHALDKIVEIASRGDGDRRAVLQLGYNLGRVAELAGLGREDDWDRWKRPASAWDRPALDALADELRSLVESRDRPLP